MSFVLAGSGTEEICGPRQLSYPKGDHGADGTLGREDGADSDGEVVSLRCMSFEEAR